MTSGPAGPNRNVRRERYRSLVGPVRCEQTEPTRPSGSRPHSRGLSYAEIMTSMKHPFFIDVFCPKRPPGCSAGRPGCRLWLLLSFSVPSGETLLGPHRPVLTFWPTPPATSGT